MNKKRLLALFKWLANISIIRGVLALYINITLEKIVISEIENRTGEIRAEFRGLVKDALRDEELRDEVADLIEESVVRELDANGEQHIRRIIDDKYPALAIFLDATRRD